jgi:opacity protein-like surface antigen
MKRFLIIAAAVAALAVLTTSENAQASDYFSGGNGYGGGHGYGGGYHGSVYRGGHSNYGYGGYGHGGFRSVVPNRHSGYGGYTPSYRAGHYAPKHQSYRPSYRHGGVHVDLGRLHFGVGGHH